MGKSILSIMLRSEIVLDGILWHGFKLETEWIEGWNSWDQYASKMHHVTEIVEVYSNKYFFSHIQT